MSAREIKIEICDRCGHETDIGNYMAGNSWGRLRLAWRGDKGSRAYDGAAGGVNIEGKADLCAQCLDEFQDFMRPIQRTSGSEK